MEPKIYGLKDMDLDELKARYRTYKDREQNCARDNNWYGADWWSDHAMFVKSEAEERFKVKLV